MPILYYYLDDGTQDESTAFSNVVAKGTDGLAIKHAYPDAFATQMKSIESSQFDAHGLILDLRLDREANKIDGKTLKADYRAPALAQEIRTRAAESRTREFPIVLWSFEELLKASYLRDNTRHDLFDLTVVKDTLKDDVAKPREVQ